MASSPTPSATLPLLQTPFLLPFALVASALVESAASVTPPTAVPNAPTVVAVSNASDATEPAASVALPSDAELVATRINLIFIMTATMSIAGAITVMRSYISRKELRTPSLQIVAVMAACDLGFALKFVGSSLLSLLGNTSAVTTGTIMCGLSGHLGQFFALSTILWNGAISLNLFMLLLNPRKLKPGRFVRIYHYIIWGYCVISAVVLGVTNQIGFTEDGTCWIIGKQNPFRLLFYGPLFVSFLFALFAVCFATYRLQVSGRDTSAASDTRKVMSRKRASLVRIYLVTIVYVFVWMWSIIFRATAFSSDKPPPLWLTYIQAFFLGSQGFFNAAAWSISVLFAPKPSKEPMKPQIVLGMPAPMEEENANARFQIMYPQSSNLPRRAKESWEHNKANQDLGQSGLSVFDQGEPTPPQQDSVWRIAVRAAAGSPSFDLPRAMPDDQQDQSAMVESVTTAATPGAAISHHPTTRSTRTQRSRHGQGHSRTRSSFYDFYDLLVFEGQHHAHDYEAHNEMEVFSSESPSVSSGEDPVRVRDDASTLDDDGGWKVGQDWSARRQWAGHE
ncbi:phosphatidylinositol-4-phosphate 5-kinase-like protein 1 [Geranomyces variabilis]|uniref:Phosphatidylinositol-4-phosphate 5-kinase-like protein 1 n=1 Tax=Geranomyces variabilis TaxID=109894 RepID=A0AAD5TKU5_9FUNG|nr:phosphatidylinositol-4-phosphate 5-kinase-like protein 1 [Geranomyces variabilis]